MDQKEYSFIPIFQDKGVDIKWSSIIISGVCGPILTCETIFCIYRISGIQLWHQCGQQNAALCFKTLFKTWSVSLVSLVQSWHVRPFFASAESQEFNYGISVCNKTRHCGLRHFEGPDQYLCCLWSNQYRTSGIQFRYWQSAQEFAIPGAQMFLIVLMFILLILFSVGKFVSNFFLIIMNLTNVNECKCSSS